MKQQPAQEQWPRVYIVILNWNQRDLTLDCLESLAALDYPSFELVLVDNGSTDGSPDEIRCRYPTLTIMENDENLGFSEGNNVGIRYALSQGADYVLLLNNDTVVDPRFLSELIQVAESDSEIGIVGPKMYYYDQPQTIWSAGARIDWSTGGSVRLQADRVDDEPDEGQPHPVDFLAACAMAVKRRVIDEIGLLDPRYFIYYDEADWCVQAVRHGYQVLHVPTSRIWHKVSAAMGTTSPATDYYMNRNVLLFLARNQRGFARLRSLVWAVGRNLLAASAYTVRSHNGERISNRNARLMALRDAILGRWGRMGPDVSAVCHRDNR